MAAHRAIDVIETLQQGIRHHLCRRSGSLDPTVEHRDHLIADTGRFIDVVEHHDNGPVFFPIQPHYELHDLELVRHVEIGGRLVEQEQRRLLRQRHGNPGALSLAPGELVDDPLAQLGHSRQAQRVLDRFFVVSGRRVQEALMREPAATNEVLHRQAFWRGCLLRQQAQSLGDFAAGKLMDELAIEHNGPARRSMDPGQSS